MAAVAVRIEERDSVKVSGKVADRFRMIDVQRSTIPNFDETVVPAAGDDVLSIVHENYRVDVVLVGIDLTWKFRKITIESQ